MFPWMTLIILTLLCHTDIILQTSWFLNKLCTPASELSGSICHQLLRYTKVVYKINKCLVRIIYCHCRGHLYSFFLSNNVSACIYLYQPHLGDKYTSKPVLTEPWLVQFQIINIYQHSQLMYGGSHSMLIRIRLSVLCSFQANIPLYC